ncbi:hypothetical protein ACFLXU_04310 [Chloroflexota bacterium]
MTVLGIIKKGFFLGRVFPLFYNLCVAIRTYKNAVFLVESSPLFGGNFLYRKPLLFFVIGIQLFSTSKASNHRGVKVGARALPEISILDRMVIKLSGHFTDTPFTGWLPSKCNPNDSCYFATGKWTGLIINYQPYALPPLPFHVVDLNRKNTLEATDDFQQAKRVAEEYHRTRHYEVSIKCQNN